jgi:hypothetical protein
VWTRFDNGLSVVDLTSGTETAHLTFFNPEPAEVVVGRPFLYDAQATSGNGEGSCSSCHVFGDFDSLAWDLGDPDGDVSTSPIPIIHDPATLPPDINGSGVVTDFHPMKGPMTTQTLRGMANAGALHWRGDRSTGFFGTDPFDEDLSFRNFIVAFSGLVGRDGNISEAEMQQFSDFALQVRLPPNPNRALDNQLTPEQQSARSFFTNTPADGPLTCEACHGLDESLGHFAANGNASFEGNPQIFKVAHLRNAYTKVGMFGFLATFGGPFQRQGDQVRGFGFSHTGGLDTLFRFVSAPLFRFPSEASRRNMESFILAFDSDLAPAVGQQVTLTFDNQLIVDERIDMLLARAREPFTSKILGGATKECEVVGRFTKNSGRSKGHLYDPDTLLFVPDDGGMAISDVALRSKANTGKPVTYTCVPPGSGHRMALDRDEDGLLDGYENDTGVFVDASKTGTNPASADTDGDGYDDGVEVAAGSDPNDPLDFPSAGAPLPALPPAALAALAALIAVLGVHQVRQR